MRLVLINVSNWVVIIDDLRLCVDYFCYIFILFEDYWCKWGGYIFKIIICNVLILVIVFWSFKIFVGWVGLCLIVWFKLVRVLVKLVFKNLNIFWLMSVKMLLVFNLSVWFRFFKVFL